MTTPAYTNNEAMERINLILSHAWMVRTFLKHADELEDDIELLTIPRAIFDFIRSVEKAYLNQDVSLYLKQVRRKFHRLKEASEFFNEEQSSISDHTNFKQAALSLKGCIFQIEEILSGVDAE